MGKKIKIIPAIKYVDSGAEAEERLTEQLKPPTPAIDNILYDLATQFAETHLDNVEGRLDTKATGLEYDDLLNDAKTAISKFYAEEMLESLPKKKLPAYREDRNLPPDITGFETTDYPRIKALKNHNQGYNRAINDFKAAIKSKYLGEK